MTVVPRFDGTPCEDVSEECLILVVDDEPAFGKIVKALVANAGCSVDSAPDAPAAFHAVRLRRYSLILMDIEMAGITGLQGVARIRQTADWTRSVPIVAFSSHHPPRGERFFLERDFDGWLPKPFTANDLFRHLKRWLPIDAPDDNSPVREGLAQIMSREELEAMNARLRNSFAQAIAAIDGGADPAPYGHRLGGLVGTMGLPVLSAAWLALQTEHRKIWDTVRRLTLEWMGVTD